MVLVAPSIERDTLRVRDEFLSLPGLTLTAAQAARLLSVAEPQARRMLELLRVEGFLDVSPTGPNIRHKCETDPPRTIVETDHGYDPYVVELQMDVDVP